MACFYIDYVDKIIKIFSRVIDLHVFQRNNVPGRSQVTTITILSRDSGFEKKGLNIGC